MVDALEWEILKVEKMKQILIILILAVMLSFTSSCTYWYKQGKTFQDCEQDLHQCYCELKKYSDMDSINSYEDNFMKDCMRAKGYTLFSEDDLPKYVKRQDPEMNTFWLLAGISGTVEKGHCEIRK